MKQQVEGSADLVVELLSESTRDYDLDEKRHLYHEAGVEEIWFVDSDHQQVIVETRHDGTYDQMTYSSGRLASSTVPGFWLDVSWLWQDPLPDDLTCLLNILGE